MSYDAWCFGAVRWLASFCGPTPSQDLVEAEKCFLPTELDAVKKDFLMAAVSRYNHGLDDQVFLEKLCGLSDLDPELGFGLCQAVRQADFSSSGPLITLHDVIIAKARAEKMGPGDSDDFAFSVVDVVGSGALARPQLLSVVRALVQWLLRRWGLPRTAEEDCCQALVAGALSYSDREDCLTPEGFQKWSAAVPAVRGGLCTLMYAVGAPHNGGPPALPSALRLPELELGDVRPSDCHITPVWAWVLSQSLPAEFRVRWRLLFNSWRHGSSYSTLMERVAGEAPTLLVLKDDGGHVVGGYAPVPWTKHGDFYGEFTTFVFSLLPATRVYRASGINAHFQWCGVGFSQLPNGIGFGGQKGNCALWLDSSFDVGVSRPAATFASPSLTHAQSFRVASVEVWAVGPREGEEEAGGEGEGASVLDRFKEERQIMQWAGVNKNHSDGYRRVDPPPELEE